MLSRVCMLCFFLFFSLVLSAQVINGDRARDTIMYRSNFLNRTYLLDGKPLTLPVMAFFMKDFPIPDHKIKLAQLTDQLCIAGYSVGSLFTIGGLLVSRQNKDLGGDLIQMGLIGIGSGLVFQVISGSFKVSAVRHYNEAVKSRAGKDTSILLFKAGRDGAGIVVKIR